MNFGPGTWCLLHFYGNMSQDEQRYFTNLVSRVIDNIPCEKCLLHARSYCEQEKIVECFEWSVDFHNVVNLRLKRNSWSYLKAEERINSNVRDSLLNPNSSIWNCFTTCMHSFSRTESLYLMNNFVKMVFFSEDNTLIDTYLKLSRSSATYDWDINSGVVYVQRFYRKLFEKELVANREKCTSCAVSN